MKLQEWADMQLLWRARDVERIGGRKADTNGQECKDSAFWYIHRPGSCTVKHLLKVIHKPGQTTIDQYHSEMNLGHMVL